MGWGDRESMLVILTCKLANRLGYCARWDVVICWRGSSSLCLTTLVRFATSVKACKPALFNIPRAPLPRAPL